MTKTHTSQNRTTTMSRSVTVTQQNNIEQSHHRACDRTIDQLYNNKSSGKPISSQQNNNQQQQ